MTRLKGAVVPETTARGHVVPSATDQPSRLGWVLGPLASVNDIVPVPDAASRQATFETINTDRPVSVDRPLFVFRADAAPGLQLEYTTNGAVWHTVAAASPGPLRILKKDTVQTIQNAQYSTVGWAVDAGDKGDGSGLVYSAGTLTVQRAGLYDIRFKVTFPANATGQRVARVMLNGAQMDADYQPARSGGWTQARVVRSVYCAAGDVLSFETYQDSGGSLTLQLGSGLNHCTVAWVRP